jgi:DNA topoisomerase-3
MPEETPKTRKKRDRKERGEKRAASPRPTQEGLLGPASAPPPVSPQLVETLKAWRKSEAQRRRVPAFRILTDRALTALAAERPRSEADLLNVPGIGPTIVEKYGREILGMLGEGPSSL